MFLVDFFIIDIEEYKEVPLILGWSFMKTAKVIIDVDDGKLKVMAQDDEVTYNVFQVLQPSNKIKNCLRIDTSNKAFPGTKKQLHTSKMLGKVLNSFIPQAVEEKKDSVPKFVEKKLTANKLYASCMKEEDKVHQCTSIMKDKFKLGQPIMFNSSKTAP